MPFNLQKLVPQTLATRLFLAITLLEASVNITIEAVILAKGEFLHGLFRAQGPQERAALPVYLAVFVLAHLYQIILAVDALANKNTIQIIGLCLFNLAFLVYSIFQIQEVKNAFETIGNPDSAVPILVTVIPIMIAITEAFYLVLTWKLYKEFGWNIYKSLGADRRIRRMFLQYQVYICLCKFDIFFFFGFSMQFWLLVLRQQDIERWLTLAAAPCTLALMLAGFYAARNEIKWLMCSFIAGCVLGAAYFSFKLYRMYSGNTVDNYDAAKKSLTVFSILSLLLLFLTILQSSILLRNFGRGLKFHVNGKSRTKAEEAGYDTDSVGGMHYKLESANTSRLSID